MPDQGGISCCCLREFVLRRMIIGSNSRIYGEKAV